MSQYCSDVKSYHVLETTPTFGLVVSTDVLPLGFVEVIDFCAVSGDNEILIGMMSSGSSNDASFGLSGLDVNLMDFAGEDATDMVLRPQFNDLGGVGSVSADITFTFNFQIQGSR